MLLQDVRLLVLNVVEVPGSCTVKVIFLESEAELVVSPFAAELLLLNLLLQFEVLLPLALHHCFVEVSKIRAIALRVAWAVLA